MCSSTASAPTTLSSCGPDWERMRVGGSEKCLKSFGKKNAADARRTCEANDSQLPAPETAGQNADYRAVFNSLAGYGCRVWLAFEDVGTEGVFVNTHTGVKGSTENFVCVTFRF